MIDLLFQIGISNAVVASLLALVAMFVSRNSTRPQIAYLLWMLVLIKLVTPPIFNLPVDLPIAFSSSVTDELPGTDDLGAQLISDWDVAGDTTLTTDLAVAPLPAQNRFITLWINVKPWLGLCWLIGTLLIVVGSLVRVARFHRLLRASVSQPDRHTMIVAREISGRLGLRKHPELLMTSARLCPMVWWIGGRVQVVLPQSMFVEMNATQCKCVLAHELAHVRRRDYLVRWLEWLACSICWWNPIVWLAQRNLRAAEEICCDELVLSSLNPGAHTYAESIFQAVESLVRPAIRPPAMASEINSGGFLERRIEMILSGNSERKNPRCWQLGLVAAAVLMVPLGLVTAQDFEAVEKRLAKSVKQDELSLEQAAHMMNALREAAEHERREQEHRHHELHEHSKDDHQHRGEHVHDEHGREHGHEHGHEHNEHEHGEHEHNEHEHGGWLGSLDNEQKYRALGDQVMLAYRAGGLSTEEVVEKLTDLKRMAEKSDFDSNQRHLELQRALDETLRVTESRRESEADAGKRIAEIKNWMGVLGAKSGDRRKQKYVKLEKELAELVKTGRIGKMQAREKLEGLEKKLWPNQENEVREEKYREVAANIEARIESGEISKVDGLKRLRLIRAKLWPDSEGDAMEARAEMEKLRDRMEAAVDAERMSSAEVVDDRTELSRRMEKMARSIRERQRESDRRTRLIEEERASVLKRAKEEMQAHVESGELTKKQAGERLRELEKKLHESRKKNHREREHDKDSNGAEKVIERELQNLELQLHELSQKLGPEHPHIKQLKSRIEAWSHEQEAKTKQERELQKLKILRNKMSGMYQPNHPRILQIDEQIEFWSRERE